MLPESYNHEVNLQRAISLESDPQPVTSSSVLEAGRRVSLAWVLLVPGMCVLLSACLSACDLRAGTRTMELPDMHATQ